MVTRYDYQRGRRYREAPYYGDGAPANAAAFSSYERESELDERFEDSPWAYSRPGPLQGSGYPSGQYQGAGASREWWRGTGPVPDEYIPPWGDGGEAGRAAYGPTAGGRVRDWERPSWAGFEPGPHAGRGPRGYRRSDESIREDVCERLMHHGYIDAGAMDVAVNDGEVTLTGDAEDRRQKRLAGDVAESVAGVRDVHNRLRVHQHPQTMQTAGPAGRLHTGMLVLSSDGEKVGEVKDVHRGSFKVDVPMQPDFWLGMSCVSAIDAAGVHLGFRKDHLDDFKEDIPPRG